MNETTSNPSPRSHPPGQPDWITPIPLPRPTASMRQIDPSPQPGEPGLESRLRDLSQNLALEWQGSVEVMWIGQSHPLDSPMAWFFCADIAGHRIHITGWDAEATPYSDTRFAVAIDGLQLPYLARCGANLRQELVGQLKIAHAYLAHTGTARVPVHEQPRHLVSPPNAADIGKTAVERTIDEHRDLSAAIRARTGLRPYLWSSDGARMAMVIPLPPDVQPAGGHYLGNVEAWDENGDASGSITFHAQTEDSGEDNQETTVFLAWETCPISLWAHAVADHYASLRGRQPLPDPKAITGRRSCQSEEG